MASSGQWDGRDLYHGRRVREDLNHPDWDGLPTLPEASPSKTKERLELETVGSLEELEGVVVTPPKQNLPLVLEENLEGDIQETLEKPPEPQQELPTKTPADRLGPPNGPLRVVSSSRKSGPGGTYKIHLLTTENKAVGCGWQPSIDKAQDLNPLDHRSEPQDFLASPQTGQWTEAQFSEARIEVHKQTQKWARPWIF